MSCARVFQCEDGDDTCVAQAQVSSTSAIDPDSPSSLDLSNGTHTEPCQLEHQSHTDQYVCLIALKQQILLNKRTAVHTPSNYIIRVESLRPFCAFWTGKNSAMSNVGFLSAVIPFTAKSLK